ncbi:hypothetical protein L7F22_001921 [Adiantum nelumboides]|nr:hypothetical protein [Adiantum nelumboides]
MPKFTMLALGLKPTRPAPFTVTLVDQRTVYPLDIVDKVPLQVQDFTFSLDFVVVRLPQVEGGFPLLIGRPWLQHTKDAPSKPPNLMSLFAKKIYVPYPDYASRVMLWRLFLERHGAMLSYNFSLSILAHLSADYSPRSMEEICKLVLTKKRLRKLRSHALVPEELISHFHEFMPLDKAILATIRNWNKPVPKPVDESSPAKKK